MSSVQHLREFISERLTAAAEEIFSLFEKTIEEELEVQRRLLDISWRRRDLTPDFSQQTITEEVVLTEPNVCVQERRSGLVEEEPGPSERSGLVEEEPGPSEIKPETCSRQEEEQLVLKQETIMFIVTSVHNEHDYSKPERNRFSSQTRPAAQNRAEHLGLSDRNPSVASGRRFNSSTGKKTVACDVCGKLFKYRYILKEHYRIHTGEKPYACTTCGKTFSQSCRLSTHRRIHTGEKPYVCNTCGNRFTDPSTLRKHTVTHTGERPYSCETCGKSFGLSSSLSVHMRTHLGETPFTCNTCGNKFTYKATLKRHMRTHTGETPYSCETCGKSFKHNSSLSVHLSTHTGEKKQSCNASSSHS